MLFCTLILLLCSMAQYTYIALPSAQWLTIGLNVGRGVGGCAINCFSFVPIRQLSALDVHIVQSRGVERGS